MTHPAVQVMNLVILFASAFVVFSSFGMMLRGFCDRRHDDEHNIHFLISFFSMLSMACFAIISVLAIVMQMLFLVHDRNDVSLGYLYTAEAVAFISLVATYALFLIRLHLSFQGSVHRVSKRQLQMITAWMVFNACVGLPGIFLWQRDMSRTRTLIVTVLFSVAATSHTGLSALMVYVFVAKLKGIMKHTIKVTFRDSDAPVYSSSDKEDCPSPTMSSGGKGRRLMPVASQTGSLALGMRPRPVPRPRADTGDGQALAGDADRDGDGDVDGEDALGHVPTILNGMANRLDQDVKAMAQKAEIDPSDRHFIKVITKYTILEIVAIGTLFICCFALGILFQVDLPNSVSRETELMMLLFSVNCAVDALCVLFTFERFDSFKPFEYEFMCGPCERELGGLYESKIKQLIIASQYT